MDSTLRKLRHDFRGHANCLMLCAAALSHVEPEERLEFIDEIISATDRLIVGLDTLEAVPEHFSEET